MLRLISRISSRIPRLSAGMVTSTEREVFVESLSGDSKGISCITLNRPKVKNALGRNMLKEFLECLQEVRFDTSSRVVIVRSAVEGVFCAGADLVERKTMNETEVAQFVHGLRSAFSGLEALPKPTICVIDGVAVGGGTEIALACDMRVASTTSIMGLPETALAIIPGAGGTQRLPRVIGIARAKELIYTARRINGTEAERIGLVNYAIAKDKGTTPYDKAVELAKEILPRGPIAVRVAKVAMSQGMNTDQATGMAIEEQCYAQVLNSTDRLEGLAAFKEKRTPIYTGK